jgi:hypothetical protein
MSFLLSLKAVSNKLNSIAKAMDEKVDTFSEQVLSLFEEYDSNLFSKDDDRVDMKDKIKSLFTMFEPEDKKPKNINGYILFTKEQREDCTKRNAGKSPTEITKMLGEEWKALEQSERDEYNTRAKSVAPQSEAEKKAKRASSKRPSKPQVTCDFSGCSKVVKNPTEHTDGCTYCSEHFKKIIAGEKKAATPKCNHVGKEGKSCTSEAVNGEWCTRHMKKSSPVVAPVAEPVAKEDEKKEKSSKKTESPKTAKDSVKDKLDAAEKKMAEAQAKLSPKSVPSSPKTSFNFKTELPVEYSSNPDYWTCKSIKLDGVTKNRLHKSGLVLDIIEPKLIGTFINGKATMIDSVSDDIKNWAKNCGIQVEDNEEDMDIQLDEELESEDEE